MELVIWHEALGSDDEQASDEELLARVLYAHGDGTADDAHRVGGLRLVQALVGFTRLLQRSARANATRANAAGDDRGDEDGDKEEDGRWLSVVLSRRRFVIQEVEPRIFMALGVTPTIDGDALQPAHRSLVRELYGFFRLFHGPISRQLETLVTNVNTDPPLLEHFTDGMSVEAHLQGLRKRHRKICVALDSTEDEGEDGGHADHQRARLERQSAELRRHLDAWVALSPARRVRRRCECFFPTLLRVIDARTPSPFQLLDGLGYFPMDQPTFLLIQSLVNTIALELDGEIASCALFFRGNLLWSTMALDLVRRLQAFLRLREQAGMDPTAAHAATVHDDQDKGEAEPAMWMPGPYSGSFLPVWASRTSYAECAIARHPAAGLTRRSDRPLHKQPSGSLNSILAEISDTPPSSLDGYAGGSYSSSSGSGGGGGSDKEASLVRQFQRYRSSTACYRNRGFLTARGDFVPSWEIIKDGATDRVWSPMIYGPRPTNGPPWHRVVVWHDAELTLLLTTKDATMPSAALELIETCLDKHQVQNLASILSGQYQTMMTREQSREKTASPLPPFIYLNRLNGAFKAHDVPRLIKTKEVEVLPRPRLLWARYVPGPTLRWLGELQESLQTDGETQETLVRTTHEGWIIARRSQPTARELYVFLDPKVGSISEMSAIVAELRRQQFSSVFL